MSKPPDMPMYAYLDSLIRPIAGECAAITYLADGALPDAFAVYALVAATPQAHFSGRAWRQNERYAVTCYTRDKRTLETTAEAIQTALLAGGFLFVSRSADRYTSDTEHWARTMDYRYYTEQTP